MAELRTRQAEVDLMCPIVGLLALAGLVPPILAASDDPHTQARDALRRYYAERLRQPFIQLPDDPEPKPSPPPWAAPLKQLSAGKPEERRLAAAYLRELVSLAFEDEHSRTAPWRATPYWGGGAEVPARDLRKEVAEELAKTRPLPDALPVLRWYLREERMDLFLEPIMTALGKVDGKEADALRAELTVGPHDNALVAAEAINQIAARKQSLPAERLGALCHHHRAAIREAARKLNAQQGGKDPGPFNAARAVRSEPVRRLLGQVLDLITELPPADADFVEVTVRHLDDKKVARQTHEVVGWLVRREGDSVEVYTPFGRPERFRNGERERVTIHERSPDGEGTVYHEIDATVDVTVAPRKVEDLVKAAAGARDKGLAGNKLSEQGPLTGQFRGSGATLYEAVLGAWLYRAKRDAEAAAILLPALDSMYTDRHLVDMVRKRLGEIHGYRMLVAFAGDRDYAEVQKQANLINARYPDTRFHRYARGLAEQLPRRQDDFKRLKLPTPAEWVDLKKKLTRPQQIDFLCERLRLLNCFQMGQPGGYWPDAKQYAEPCGMDSNASWGRHKGKTEVINPWKELRGPLNWFDESKPRPRGMNLTLEDVPQLSRYLRDDWYMPIVGFWRDFHPDRSLTSTRPVFAEIIDGLAHQDLCKTDGWDKLTPAQIDREIERINAWAKANAGKSRKDLKWQALDALVARGEDWYAVQGRVEGLLKETPDRAYDVMKRYLEGDKTNAWSKSMILETYLKNDVARARDLAPKSLGAKDGSLRFVAALIVFRTGEKARARGILGEGLATGEGDRWFADAVNALLDDNSTESRRQVARMFTNRRLAHGRNEIPGEEGAERIAEILGRCAKEGMKEPYRFYLPLLDIHSETLPIRDENGRESGATYFRPTVAESYARVIVNKFAPDDPAVREIAKKFPKPADQIPHLKEWLRSRAGATKE